MPEFTIDYLKECFEADFEAGHLFWKNRPAGHFSSATAFKRWNTRYAGTRALNNLSAGGYKVGSLNGRAGVRAHRILYALAHGHHPESVDHINGNKTDNSRGNLRSVSHKTNMRNVKLSSSNTSGTCGVGWDKAQGKWRAQIKTDGKTKTLGVFVNKEDAVAARKKSERGLGFGPMHGVACL